MPEPTRDSLSDFERSLAGLVPHGGPDRDAILFQAGAHSVRTCSSRLLPVLTLVLGLALGSGTTWVLQSRSLPAPSSALPTADLEPTPTEAPPTPTPDPSSYWRLGQELVRGEAREPAVLARTDPAAPASDRVLSLAAQRARLLE